MAEKKDWTGQKYNRLTFVKRSEEHIPTKWECLCDCGNTTFVSPNKVFKGTTRSCGCLKKEVFSKQAQASNIVRGGDPDISAAKVVWRNGYTDSGLDFDTFYALSQQTCHYCGRAPHRTKQYVPYENSTRPIGYFTFNGLDRIDSSIGHIKDNVVPCCMDCNRAKSDMTYDEFCVHIKRMYEHLQLSK